MRLREDEHARAKQCLQGKNRDPALKAGELAMRVGRGWIVHLV